MTFKFDMVNKLLNPSESRGAEELVQSIELKSPNLPTNTGPDKHIEPTPPEAITLNPIQTESPLLYEEEDETTKPNTGMEQANEALRLI